MFSSNQILEISGRLKENKTIVKIFELIDSFGVKFDSYGYLENGSLCFYQYNYNEDKISKIDIEDRHSDYYTAIVSMYFTSNKYKTAMVNTFNEYAGADGGSYEGWKISVKFEGLTKMLVVEPYWCFYHK